MTSSPTFGELLKQYRLAVGLTQAALGERAHVSERSISEMERGLRPFPYRYSIMKLARALQLSEAAAAQLQAAAKRGGRPHPQRSAAAGHAIPADPAISAGPSVSLASPAPPFVGRHRERAELERFLASGGSPRLLLLSGEPGIGKTRLLAEVIPQAQAAGWRIIFGGCQRGSAQEPYAPLVGALGDLLAQYPPAQRQAAIAGASALVGLLPELAEWNVVFTPRAQGAPGAAAPAHGDRRLLFAAVGQALANVAGEAGSLLLLDDLQWAGADALALLASLLRATPLRPLQVIGAYRNTENQPGDPLETFLADLARDGLVSEPLALGPLDPVEARLLLREALAQTPAPSVNQGETTTAGNLLDERVKSVPVEQSELIERLAQRAGGLPFFLLSCAQGLRAGDLTTGDAEELGVPWTVAQTIRQRVAALPSSAQELLHVAAVMGSVAPHTLLAAVTAARGVPAERDLTDALDAVDRAGLLIAAQDAGSYKLARDTRPVRALAYRFAHDLVRETIFDAISPARRLGLHRAVAEAIERAPESERQRQAAELADHLTRAGEPGRALPYALLAGDQAEAVYAHSEAETHYRAALELAHASGAAAREAEALEKLGSLLRDLGRSDEAFALLDRGIQGHRAVGNRVGELRTLAALVPIYGQLAIPDEGVARAQAILSIVEAQDTENLAPTLGAVYISLANLYFHCGRPQDQLASAKRAVELACAAGDDILLARALHWRNLAALYLRLTDEMVDMQELIALAERAGETWIVAYSFNHLAWECLQSGEIAQGRSYIARAVEVAEQRRDPKLLVQMWIGAAELSYYSGEWARARDEVARAAAIQRELDQFNTSWGSAYPLLLLGTLDVAQGRDEVGKQRLEQAIELAAAIGDPQALAFAGKILAECDLLAGRAAEARDRLKWLRARCRQAEQLDLEVLQPLMAWAELELGSREVAAALASVVASAPGLWRVDALRVQALLAIEEERWKDGEHALDRALALSRAMPYPYSEAKALFVYGRLHAARDRPEQAREKYQAALVICLRLGETLYRPHVERALAGMNAAGGSTSATS
jgi:transcriptional regulator with XRE-family HTH domain/tetratricopeptide (TPR) repeat protein